MAARRRAPAKRRVPAARAPAGAERPRRPTLAVWKFASCDGCQLTLLSCEDELLAIAGRVDIAYFLEASSGAVRGPYDVSLVEGSITTAHDAERIRRVREDSRFLVTIGACATAGGIQTLRNFQDVREFTRAVYAKPEYIKTLASSTPISAHVKVDFELQGCPINKAQLLEVLSAYLHGRAPVIRNHSVCVECKRRGTVCVMVARGTPCLGPVTHAGCGAICPAYDRGCYGCYGPMESPNTNSLTAWWRHLGVPDAEIARAYRGINGEKEPFRGAAEALGLPPGAPDRGPRDPHAG
jgi:coenzyme F420-reducing hydrogenase gamma subunit